MFQPNFLGPLTRTGTDLYQLALAGFYKQNPGVEVKLVSIYGDWWANPQQIIAGTAADVIWDYYPPSYMASQQSKGLLWPLDAWMQRDGIDVTAWSAGQIGSYRQAAPDHQLYMLPNYFSPLVYVVRLSDFDSEGYPRPDPNWTYSEFTTMCSQMTKSRSTGLKRYGAVLDWHSSGIGGATWPFYCWGDGMVTAQGYAQLNTTAGLQAGSWLYEELLWPGYATVRNVMDPGANPQAQIQDQVVAQLVWGGSQVLYQAEHYTGFLWDYYLPPQFPNGYTCSGTDDFFAIPASTKHPEQAWELLKFISYDATPTGWQQQNMKITLIQPCLNSLWDMWIHTLQSVAPPLRDKNLNAFKTMALNGRALPEEYFPYGDSQVRNLEQSVLSNLWNQTTTVPSGWHDLDLQINALVKTLIPAG